jgi:hypothetical protein
MDLKWTNKNNGIVFYSKPQKDLNLVHAWLEKGEKEFLIGEVEEVKELPGTSEK